MKNNQSNRNNRKNWLLSLLLKHNQLTNRNSEGGYILIIALGIVLALSGLLALYAKSNRFEVLSATSTVDSNSGFYAAEAGLNLRAEKIRKAFESDIPKGTPPESIMDCFDNDPTNDGTDDLACVTYDDFVSASEHSANYKTTTYVVEKGAGLVGTVPKGDPFQGTSMIEQPHSLYSVSYKGDDYDNKPIAILEMEIKSRLIPLFQFAAFYTEDLEILPSPLMTLSGPVHTNKDLYLGSNNTLRICGQVTMTAGHNMYHRRKDKNTQYDNGDVKIIKPNESDCSNNSNYLDLLFNGTGKTQKTSNPMDPKKIANAWGTQVLMNLPAPLQLPEAKNFGRDNTPTDSSDDYEYPYFHKADIRIEFEPQATSSSDMNYLSEVPFSIRVAHRTDKSGNELNTPIVENLSEDQLRSLRQPIMVSSKLASIPASSQYHLCQGLSYPNDFNSSDPVKDQKLEEFKVFWSGLREDAQRAIAQVIQNRAIYAIQYERSPLPLSTVTDNNQSIKQLIGDDDTMKAIFGNQFISKLIEIDPNISDYITNLYLEHLDETGMTLDIPGKMTDLSLPQIAALPYKNTDGTNATPRCFIPAPISEVGRDSGNHQSPFRYYNNREKQEMRLLQLNMRSLTVWNEEGIFIDFDSLGTTLKVDQDLFYQAPADTSAPANSWQRLGMAANDISEGGIVIHLSVDPDEYPKAVKWTKDLKPKSNTSPYGFAFVEGAQLFALAETDNQDDPTGVTIVSDQAVYPQGDYNTLNKQPASFLADTLNPLSNACISADGNINRNPGIGCDVNGTTSVKATDTTFNAAVLAGTDITNGSKYNGGLENYPRFQENWSKITWRYRGSFVSLSQPYRSKGDWGQSNVYSPPKRDWDYDLSFNDPKNLPPLTPKFVHLKQESFVRQFEKPE